MEGISAEAGALAGHLGLGKLIYLYDQNCISVEGETDLAFTERVATRFDAQGWHVQHVENGNDLDDIEAAIDAARDATERPSIICVHTHIGYGSPQQDTANVHGSPHGEDDLAATKEHFDWPTEPRFHVPEAAYEHCRRVLRTGAEQQTAWEDTVEAYREAHPDSCRLFLRAMDGEVPEYEAEHVPTFQPGDGPPATRNASSETLQDLATNICTLVGSSADLASSNKTHLEGYEDFTAGQSGRSPETTSSLQSGRNLHFGVREHAMGAIYQRDCSPRRPAAVRRYLLHLLRLHAPGAPPRGADGPAPCHGVYARFDRARGGRAHPPAGGAPDGHARYFRLYGPPPRRRQ
jgi:transketolase